MRPETFVIRGWWKELQVANRRNHHSKDAASEDVLPMVPVVIYPRDGDDGGEQERQDDDAQLGDVPSSVEDGDLPGEVPRQEPQAGKGPGRVATWEALVAFFDHAGVAVAYDCCGDVVVHLGNKGTSLSLGAR